MRRHFIAFLAFSCMALVLLLAYLWVDKDGRLRNVHWQPPAPLAVDYLQMLPSLPQPTQVPASRFIELLERPVFSPTRRPPPPLPPHAQPVPVDVLSTAQLSAIYEGPELSGVILVVNAKPRRIRINESLDGWVLRSVQGRVATFVYNDQQRQLQLMRAKVGTRDKIPPSDAPGAAPAR